MQRLLLIACVSLALAAFAPPAEAQTVTDAPAATLWIGDPAPPIDIADWVHPGFHHPVKPFRDFAPGTIYVLEFWATWCEYSREAIPLLAELQRTHGGRVAIVAVAVDLPEYVRGFVADADPDVREIAGVACTYCLVSDDDGSVYDDYMEAICENGLPTAFIVGRDGRIEWIGHPANVAAPLDEVVAGSWDREAFAKSWSRLQAARRVIENVVQYVAADRVAAAATLIDRFAEANAADASSLNEIAWLVVERSDQRRLPTAVLEAAERAAARSTEITADDGNVLDTLAHVQALLGHVDRAIATQRLAVERGGDDADRFRDYLRRLESLRR